MLRPIIGPWDVAVRLKLIVFITSLSTTPTVYQYDSISFSKLPGKEHTLDTTKLILG